MWCHGPRINKRGLWTGPTTTLSWDFSFASPFSFRSSRPNSAKWCVHNCVLDLLGGGGFRWSYLFFFQQGIILCGMRIPALQKKKATEFGLKLHHWNQDWHFWYFSEKLVLINYNKSSRILWNTLNISIMLVCQIEERVISPSITCMYLCYSIFHKRVCNSSIICFHSFLCVYVFVPFLCISMWQAEEAAAPAAAEFAPAEIEGKSRNSEKITSHVKNAH